MEDLRVKIVLDSVHGSVEIPAKYFEAVIDTSYFQRLRRIEQNSCRSVFPSARHDRFIHSIGVYHIGSRIADNISLKYGLSGKNILPDNYKSVLESYKLACLLHDVGHTPFSHTFENYFDYEKTKKLLIDRIDDNDYEDDLLKTTKPATHEAISAYVAVKIFGNKLNFEKDNIDWSLVVRMITGVRFIKRRNRTFENAMIELLHGEIIDADRLDYVCRDVWAGGYKNLSVDLTRLINSIGIYKDVSGQYSVIYSSKALNEIEAVLNIKNFQYLYVLNHHKVLLEQHYLVEAMKLAACDMIGLPIATADQRDDALRSLCDLSIYFEPKVLGVSRYRLYMPCDDDFVAIMKQSDGDNPYRQYWLERKYPHVPLWKSKLEYFNIFKSVLGTVSEGIASKLSAMLKSDECKSYICQHLGLDSPDMIVRGVKAKISYLDAEKINVSLNNTLIPYSQLKHDSFAVIGTNVDFCYIYVNISKLGNGDTREKKMILIELLKDFISKKLRGMWVGN